MFRIYASSGASTLVLCSGMLASCLPAIAQTSGSALPAVIVEAPKQRPAAHVAKKPQRQATAVARHKKPVAMAAANPQAPQRDSSGVIASLGTPPIKRRFALPQESYSITAKQIDDTINLQDPEDAIKYFPSLFVRKRNDGDNQAVLATRTWGLASSARTLIYDDDLLVSALIGNNNSGASPHWNLVAPESIARIDFLNGPYAAAYPGNSMGGVLLITPKMPDKFEASVKETVSVQPWNQYDTKNTYTTSATAMSVGNRNGNLSWLFSANYLDGYLQPLTYTTNATAPAGTVGTITAL